MCILLNYYVLTVSLSIHLIDFTLFPGIQDENGAYFIDSCPKYFGIILNFLRIGVMEKVANVDLKFLRNAGDDSTGGA